MTAYGDILSSLEEFFEFCRTFGLQVGAEGGRFGVYHSCITQLSAELDRLRAGENQVDIYKKLRAELPRYLVALGESGEIREMLPFLRTCPPAELTPKLRALLSGPELPSEEDLATNQARNIQFELWLATVLWRGGAQIELTEPDLRCKIGEITILLACKRVLSVKQLTKRINQAIKQVRQNLKSFAENTSWGFVAISFSNLLGMEDSKVVKDRREALDRLESAIEKLINRRRPKWHQSREAQGIIFHAKAPFTNHETNRIEFGAFLQLFGEGPVCEALAKLIGPNALH
jgi:hypothetical protein